MRLRCYSTFAVALTLLFSGTPRDARAITGTQNEYGNDGAFQFSLAYWNDNFIVTRNLTPILKVGADDHVTASFMAQSGVQKGNLSWFLNGYYHILTNKQTIYRTDLLSIYPSIRVGSGRIEYEIGAGGFRVGVLGGSYIQNSYHRARSIKPVILPYYGEGKGLLLHSAVCVNEPILRQIILFAAMRNTYRTMPGPAVARFEGGVESEWYSGRLVRITTQLLAGYARNYQSAWYLKPIFGRGEYQAVLARLELPYGGISAWLSRGVYGLNETHFGTRLSFTTGTISSAGLRDVIYP